MSGDVLGPEWHISADGFKILDELVGQGQPSSNKQKLIKAALDVDLKNIGKPFLANELSKGKTSKVVLQIQKIRNISAPKANEGSQAAPRMLKLTLTDGDSYAQAIELTPINAISRDKTPPGTKVVIDSAKIVGGYILLSPENCSVLGGQVPHMVEKWLLAKSVQQSHNRKACTDGAPPWVPFGSRIVEDNQEGGFKSLGKSENKDSKSESSEFDQQRKEAIAEASSTAVRKTFGGRAKQNVQPTASNQNRNFQDRGRRFGKGGSQKSGEDYEAPERPYKPAEKVSLFDFLSDKLPITETKPQESVAYKKASNNYQSNNTRPSYQKDNNRYERTNPTPSQSSQGYNKVKTQEQKSEGSSTNYSKSYGNQNETQNKTKPSNTYQQQKPGTNRNNEPYNQKNKNVNNYQDREDRNNQQNRNTNNYQDRGDQSQSYNKNNYVSNSNPTSNKNDTSKVNNTQSNTNNDVKSFSDYNSPRQKDNRYKENSSNSKYGYEPYNNTRQPTNQPPPTAPSVAQISQDMPKMSLNSEFAKRSLRNHLNIVPSQTGQHIQPGQQRVVPPQSNGAIIVNHIPPIVPVNYVGNNIQVGLQVGQECMAKYWEDGRFYNALVTGVTDRTYVVKFRDYGNIEEVFKSDCFSAANQFPRNHQFANNQYQNSYAQPQPYNNGYIGKMEFKRRHNYNN